MREQPEWEQHAAFMDSLAADGFLLFGGPLAGTDKDRTRALHIVRARSEVEVSARLDADPWTRMDLLTSRIEPWEILLGRERMQALLESSA